MTHSSSTSVAFNRQPTRTGCFFSILFDRHQLQGPTKGIMKFRVLFAIIVLSATTSVISGAPVRTSVVSGVPVLPGGASVVSGAPVRPGGDQAVEKGFFDNIQDSYWQAMALQHQLAQLAEQIQDADDDDSSEMAHLTAQWNQLQAQAQPIIDQVYG